jgi:hypothetical protein
MQRQIGRSAAQCKAVLHNSAAVCASRTAVRRPRPFTSSSSAATSHICRGDLQLVRSQFDVDDSTVEKLNVDLGPR